MTLKNWPARTQVSVEVKVSGGWPANAPVPQDLWEQFSLEYGRFKAAVEEAGRYRERLEAALRAGTPDTRGGQLWGWEKFEARMAARLQEIRQVHAARLQEAQLAIAEAERALGPAVLPFTQWPPYTPPSAPPGGVTLGWIDLETQDSRVGAAAILPLPAARGVLYQASGPELEAATGAAQALLLRLCAAFPRNQIEVTLIDPIGFGRALGRFVQLHGKAVEVTGGHVLTEPTEIEEVLGRLADRLRTAIKTGAAFGGTARDRWHILMINSFPVNFTARACDLLAQIVPSGPEAGVLPVIVMDTAARAFRDPNTAALERACLVLAGAEGRFAWRGHPELGDVRLDLDRPPDDLQEFIHAIGTAPPGLQAPGAGGGDPAEALQRHAAALAACRDAGAAFRREVQELYDYWRSTEYYNEIGKEWNDLCAVDGTVEELVKTLPWPPAPQVFTGGLAAARSADEGFVNAVAAAHQSWAELTRLHSEVQQRLAHEQWLLAADAKYRRFLLIAGVALGLMALIPPLSFLLLVPLVLAVATPLFRLQSVVRHVADFNAWVAVRANRTEALPRRLRWWLKPVFHVVTWIARTTGRFVRNEFARTGLQVVLYTVVGCLAVGVLISLAGVAVALVGMAIAALFSVVLMVIFVAILIGFPQSR